MSPADARDDGTRPGGPATPRLASTVLLLRDGDAGPEVFVQRRRASMRFAAGMTVFPGGGVDDRDFPGDVDGDGRPSPAIAWDGPESSWWGDVLGVEPGTARALVCAAVRETFEESGVLLARRAGEGDVARHPLDPAEADDARRALESREVALADLLAGRDLRLRADLLRPWANWLTPESNPIRYDTFFFLAAVPEGQDPDGRTGEADAAGWARPADLLERWAAGEVGLMPPTWAQLRRLEHAADVDAALALADGTPIPRTSSDFLGEPFMDGFFAVATHLGHLREGR
ncbi:NUDIX hydrolase [Corynebacterium sp. 335C]